MKELSLAVFLCLIVIAIGVIPTGQIKVYGRSEYLYAAPATFSASLPSYTSYGRLLQPTNADDGCDPIITKLAKSVQYYLLVSRGVCSFQDKQSAAYYAGAKGVIVYNTLEGIYQGQNYSSSTDYDCENGMGYVSEVTYPVYSDEMDAKMPVECTNHPNCESRKCVVTNDTDSLGTKVCCAWDLYLTMGADSDAGKPVDLPAVFIRMADMAFIQDLPDSNIEIQLYQRPLYWEFVSVLLLYVMAVGTLTYGAFRVAMTDRKEFNDAEIEELHRKKRGARAAAASAAASPVRGTQDSDLESSQYQGGLAGSGDESEAEFAASNPLLGKSSPRRDSSAEESEGLLRSRKSPPGVREEDTIELHSGHAIAFVVFSSLFLVLLYLVDITRIVTWVYLVLAAIACTAVCVYPVFRNFLRFFLVVQRGMTLTEAVDFLHNIPNWRRHLPYGSAFATCLALSIIWYINRNASWAWLVQDFMGVCVCLLCLETILIPNLKVATALLSLAFCYDIFFVFISPYIFSTSVMEEVATGSSDSNSDPNYCEKYPDDPTYCADTSLPMLLQVPTLFTYLEGNSILGLGDVVLPGLLAVWAARHDIRQFGKLDFDQFNRGFFPLAVKTYCLGLLLADGAVMIFETGQPALLYIVPCLLGSILYRSFANDTLALLWSELPTMKLVALPIHSDETDSLLSNTNVVVAEAIWNKTREHDYITVLDHTQVAPVVDTSLAEYQNSILSSQDSSAPFRRSKKTKARSGSKSYSETSTAILDSNTSASAAMEDTETLTSFVPTIGRSFSHDSDNEPI